eukprot:scaffold5046_cov95-Pinguiococcus_pyrenoidosus.AAC.1
MELVGAAAAHPSQNKKRGKFERQTKRSSASSDWSADTLMPAVHTVFLSLPVQRWRRVSAETVRALLLHLGVTWRRTMSCVTPVEVDAKDGGGAEGEGV